MPYEPKHLQMSVLMYFFVSLKVEELTWKMEEDSICEQKNFTAVEIH